MYEKDLPFGYPVFFEGEYKHDRIYPLYIQMISCTGFDIKENKIPTIQIKSNAFYKENEYLEHSKNKGEVIVLCMTNIDLKLALEQYTFYDLEYISGWKFKAMNGLFKNYIDKWIKEKNEGTIEKNGGKRTRAKLMLNSLYGKFAKSMKIRSKYPILGDDEIIHYKFSDEEIVDGLYIPIASFITSYAREKTIRTSQAIKEYSIKKYGKDLYCYSDTDSIHCLLPIEELKQFCEIDSVELGKWKHESTFSKARFVRQKTYIEMINDKMEITCSGLPKQCYKYVTWDNFKTGFTCGGKLTYKHVKGGVILEETDFTIKDDGIVRNLKALQDS